MADEIRKCGWEAKTGIYYTDEDTNKLREMDVFGVQTLEKPRKSKGVGAPLINIYLNCECKSLAGTNVLFLPDRNSDPYDATVHPFWIGRELETIVTNIADQAKISDHGRIKRLYDYSTGRAFAKDHRAVNANVAMEPPPVDAVSWSFRETRGGKFDDGQTGDRNQSTPFWNAIKSALDASRAARRKVKETSFEWVHGLNLKFYGTTHFANSAAFFLDSELFRSVYFHSVIVLDARLWRVKTDEIREINSARLYLSSIEHDNVYVDVVRSEFISQYIEAMIKHYEKSSKRSISKQWARITEIGWAPGQQQKKLLAILRSKVKK